MRKQWPVSQICLIIIVTSIAGILFSCESQDAQPIVTKTPVKKLTLLPPTKKPPLTPIASVIEIADGGFLSQDPCGPPCFFGLIPDKSTENDVLDFLEQKAILEYCETWDTRAGGGIRGIDCGSGFLVFEFLDSNVVDMISFSLSKKITVEEVLALYGDPDGVFVGWDIDDQGNLLWLAMDILYYDINTRVALPTQYDQSNYMLTESTEVIGITYRSRSKYEQHEIYIATPWSGYVEYPASPIP